MFNSFSFCSYRSGSNTPISLPVVDTIAIQNGIFDVMHVADLDIAPSYPSVPDGWDLDTIMCAEFNGDTSAGNVDYAFYLTSSLRVKRRERGSIEWITLTDIPVSSPEDFSFVIYDKLNRSQTTYEYAIIPVLNSVEGAIVAKEVYSDFDGVCVFNDNEMYTSIMDVSVNPVRAQLDGVVNPIAVKYPYYVKRAKQNYHKGDCTAFFLPSDSNACGVTTYGGLDYRESLVDFLTNEDAKILKDGVGHIWIIQVQGDVQDVPMGHPDHVQSKFNWVEIGNAKTARDLTEFGFIEQVGGS